MEARKALAETIREILRDDLRVAIVLAEILRPPPALEERPRPWET